MNALDYIRAARADGYALAALNAVNLETAQAAVRAAEAEHAPVILQFSQNAARYADLRLLAAIGRELRAGASVPVILHFDHAETPGAAREALRQGFDGVMMESDDAALLRALADEAHAAGSFLEAEYEVVAKGERAATQHGGSAGELERFIQNSGCDLLAVSIGSVHKQEAKTSRLDLRRLDELAAQTDLPLVLHGASGVMEADMTVASQRGISKVNVATELLLAFTHAVRDGVRDSHDPRQYLGAGRDAYEARARHVIRLLGGSGTAP